MLADYRSAGGANVSRVPPSTCTYGAFSRWITFWMVTVALTFGLSASVSAQSQPPDWYEENAYTFDPHGLISLLPWVSAYGSGTDVWEVWVCWTPGGTVANLHDPYRLTKWLNEESEVIPYFRWLSGDRYRPTFKVGGEVTSSYFRQSFRWEDCVDRVKAASQGGSDGALIIDTSSSEEGWAGPGEWCLADDCRSFPTNDRWAIVGGDAFADTYVHEIGHALHWPHSFSGSSWSEYDNPMDVMGSPTNDGKREWRATLAVNRYAAGWIDSKDVTLWHSGKVAAKFRIDPIGVQTSGGRQMIALPYASEGVFDMLGARVRGGYDRDIPKEGIEVYFVDERSGACDNQLACISLDRRVQQRGAGDAAEHVLVPGESLSIPVVYRDGTSGARVVTVKRRVGDSFDVVIGPPYLGTFRDDDNSVHEVNIEVLAQEGITAGCDTDLDLFCPYRPVTRAQLAVMLIRATEGETSLPPATGSVYSDVAADAWYAAHLERFALQAWTNPNGDFRPDDPATRADVAEFMARLLPSVVIAPKVVGRFHDVPRQHQNILAIEALAKAEVTKGCGIDPPLFCPDKPVTRAEIASLLVRAVIEHDVATLDSYNIAVGAYHSCVTNNRGRAVCWGNNEHGQTEVPVGKYIATAGGRRHSCGLLADHTIVCWGDNSHGQANAPVGKHVAVSSGGDHSCAIKEDQTIVCWGRIWEGQTDAPQGTYHSIAAGSAHSCAIRADLSVVCWGYELDGDNWPRPSPTDTPEGHFSTIGAGGAHSCALGTDQTIECWGNNSAGQADPPVGRYTAVTAGGWHSCGLRIDRTIVCWGESDSGQLDVPSGQYAAVAAGAWHSCGLLTDQTVVCWGENSFGQTIIPPRL